MLMKKALLRPHFSTPIQTEHRLSILHQSLKEERRKTVPRRGPINRYPCETRLCIDVKSCCSQESEHSILRDLDRLQQDLCFVHRFLKFERRDRIRHDSTSGLDLRFAVFENKRPDRYTRVHIAGVIKITHRSGVNAARRLFQFMDYLDSSNLWRARNRAGGEARRQSVKPVKSMA